MKKRLLSGLLVLVMLLAMLPVSVLAETPATYTVVFEGQDPNGTWCPVGTVSVAENGTVNADDVNAAQEAALALRGEGYEFAGWSYQRQDYTWVAYESTTPITDILISENGTKRICANYTEVTNPAPAPSVKYTVKFRAQDTNEDWFDVATVEVEEGAVVSNVAAVAAVEAAVALRGEGFAFAYWSYEEAPNSWVVYNGEVVTANLELYANYTQVVAPTVKYTVEFLGQDADDVWGLVGSSEVEENTAVKNTSAEIAAVTRRGEGYKFTYWSYQDADGTWKKYENTPITSAMTLYANYEEIEEAPEVKTYYIKAGDGKHGDITPEGIVSVTEGGDRTFWFYPDKGYEVSAVYVDGKLVSYYGLCYDHYWNCKGCNDCLWIDWSRWYGHDDWCGVKNCKGYHCDHKWYSCYWTDLQDGITFYDVDADHTLYVEFAPIDVECESAYYRDLDTDAWYHEATDFVIKNDLMKGVGGKSFDPYGSTTRGQLVTILYRLAGEPKVSGVSEFKDVAADQWYTNAVIWAADKGIVNGYGDGTFGVEDVITREQTVAILYRYAKYKGCDVSDLANLNIFVDAEDISEFAEKPFGWAVEEDIVEGKATSGWKLKLDPAGSTVRVEMAAMIARYVQYVG